VAFTVTLEDELGMELASVSENGHFEKLLEQINDKNMICLKFIDPYGIAVFNRLQMQYLISELSLSLTKAIDKESTQFINATVEMAKRCKAEENTYIYFYGDRIKN
jgi:hypothetical protein